MSEGPLGAALLLLLLTVIVVLLAAAEAYMPVRMPATISCMGAKCKACARLEVKDHLSKMELLTPCIVVDFEGRDMAVHFTGYDNDTVVFEKELSGESPIPVCYLPKVNEYLEVCLAFNNVNSIGNSLQICTKMIAGIINNPARAFANTGCFVADTQASSITYTINPREHNPEAR
ncbi:Protein Ycf2 [Frankliniella fusca]|uniref:Protein Ycf2 n=1 Tax=Frankliniella fusca TaxID=407009 RepID=A0AAE1LNC1_9NEOP|nr:Protein Ycf2 [Frankliniella fusca]